MATKTFDELIAGATQIKQNELPETNTHNLVGEQLIAMAGKQKEVDLQSDVINVTTKFPLATGSYYTQATARAAVTADYRKLGKKLLYQTSADTWIEEKFIGSATTDVIWNVDASWQGSASKNDIAQLREDLNTFEGVLFKNAGFIDTTGKINAGADRYYTDYIRISKDQDITLLSESNNGFVNALSFYDINKTYISGICNNQTTVVSQTILSANIPANAAYITLSTTTVLLYKSFVKYGSIQNVIQKVDSDVRSEVKKGDDLIKINALYKILGKNLFDYTAISENYYLGENGQLYPASNFFASDFILIQPNTTYSVTNVGSNAGPAFNVFYDINKNVISSIKGSVLTNIFTTPANCYWIRLSGGNLSIKTNVQLELGNVPTTVVPYTEYKPLTDFKNTQEITNKNKLDKVLGKNLLNPNDPDIIVGSFLAENYTQINPIYSISGYINVTGLDNITINYGLTGAYIVFYNENKGYISSSKTGRTFVVPENAVYLRVSGPSTMQTNWQVESGTISTTFEPYTTYGFMKNITIQIPDRETICILPKKIYFVKGKQSCIYYENVLFKNLNDPTSIYFDKGANYNRQVKFNFPTAAYNQAMTSQIIRSFKIGELKTITYDVIDPAINNGKTVNALHIGDSFTDIGTWVKETKALMETQGVTYNLLGTCGNSTFRAEGLSGGTLANTFLNTSSGIGRRVQVTGITILPSTEWPGQTYRDANGKDWTVRSGKIDVSGNGYIVVTKFAAVESDFTNFPASGVLTKISAGVGDVTINYSNSTACYFNPFINPTTGLLDITNYITTWGFANPDLVLFQFTFNDISNWSSDGTLSSLVASFKTAADHVHSAYSNAKIIFSIEPFGSINGNRDWNGRKYSVLRFVELLLIQFEDDINYNTWVKIAPSYAFVDMVNGYSSGTVTPCERYSITEISGGDGVHPSTGMLQIADCVSQIVSAII